MGVVCCGVRVGGAHLGVAVALIERRVAAEEVKVAAAVDVPHEDALAAVEHHGEGVVVVCAVELLPVYHLRREGVGWVGGGREGGGQRGTCAWKRWL
jgi:hypothetical protein